LVYKIKTKSDGSVECYKARLIAIGFSQKYGIGYEETFASVSKMITIHTPIEMHLFTNGIFSNGC